MIFAQAFSLAFLVGAIVGVFIGYGLAEPVRDDRRPHKTSGFGAGPKSLLSHKHSNSPGGAHDHA